LFTGTIATTTHPHRQWQDEVNKYTQCLLGCREHGHSTTDLLHCVQPLTSHAFTTLHVNNACLYLVPSVNLLVNFLLFEVKQPHYYILLSLKMHQMKAVLKYSDLQKCYSHNGTAETKNNQSLKLQHNSYSTDFCVNTLYTNNTKLS